MTNLVGNFPSWPDLIAEMGLLKREVEAANGLYPATIPHLAAAQEQLAAAEARLGYPLDPQHREFLSYGNGWPDFSLETTLLSAEEIGQGENWERISNTLDAFYDSLPVPGIVPPRQQIYPISYDAGASDIFAIWMNGPIADGGHPVLWLPWQDDSEPYSNFFDFFSACYQTHEQLLAEAGEK